MPATRNVRLAAIHDFFRYCAAEHPDHLELCQRVLTVPFKRARFRPVEYLKFDEIQAVLTAIDRTTADGRRDHALPHPQKTLRTSSSGGVRIGEQASTPHCMRHSTATDLCPTDISLHLAGCLYAGSREGDREPALC